MDILTAVNNLYNTYKDYGADREQLTLLIADGLERGFTVRQAYNGVRMILGHENNVKELFTVSEVAEMLECSEKEVIEQIEQLKSELERKGEDTSKYFIEPQQSFKLLYFPKKM